MVAGTDSDTIRKNGVPTYMVEEMQEKSTKAKQSQAHERARRQSPIKRRPMMQFEPEEVYRAFGWHAGKSWQTLEKKESQHKIEKASNVPSGSNYATGASYTMAPQ